MADLDPVECEFCIRNTLQITDVSAVILDLCFIIDWIGAIVYHISIENLTVYAYSCTSVTLV